MSREVMLSAYIGFLAGIVAALNYLLVKWLGVFPTILVGLLAGLGWGLLRARVEPKEEWIPGGNVYRLDDWDTFKIGGTNGE